MTRFQSVALIVTVFLWGSVFGVAGTVAIQRDTAPVAPCSAWESTSTPDLGIVAEDACLTPDGRYGHADGSVAGHR